MKRPLAEAILTAQERQIIHDVGELGQALWLATLKVSGLGTDPRMMSAMLYKRLWSNHRGFMLLWEAGLSLEAEIVLRAGLEAAICIAANCKLQEEFVYMMRLDAAFTAQGQIKLKREAGDIKLLAEYEASLREMRESFRPGDKAAKLSWSDLAVVGEVPQLYTFHRSLSGLSSHVTGLSVISGVASAGMSSRQELLKALVYRHVLMMATATVHASAIHSIMLDNSELLEAAHGLLDRMTEALELATCE